MANRHRGEIRATIDGREWTLCLTLGALAELEGEFDAQDLGALLQKLGTGRFTARQMTAILAAGLRGGGHDIGDSEAAQMRCEGGVAAMARIVADLLSAAFGAGEAVARKAASPNPRQPQEG